MATTIEVHGSKVYGTGVNHGLEYLKKLRQVELNEMLDHARKSPDRDHHFEAHIPGKGKQHYVLIHKNAGAYELKWKS